MLSACHLSTFWRLERCLGRFISILVKLSGISENMGLSVYWSYTSTVLLEPLLLCAYYPKKVTIVKCALFIATQNGKLGDVYEDIWHLP